MNRVVQLADRKEGFVPENSIPFKNLVPLDEIIADAKQVSKTSIAVEKEYHQLISRYGTELDILTKVPQQDFEGSINPRIAEGIVRVRKGQVRLEPGYDGEYGKVSIFGSDETKACSEEQMSLF